MEGSAEAPPRLKGKAGARPPAPEDTETTRPPGSFLEVFDPAVKELTLRNYRSPKTWRNFNLLAAAAPPAGAFPVGSCSSPRLGARPAPPPPPPAPVSEGTSFAFPQLLLRSCSKGKGVALRPQPIQSLIRNHDNETCSVPGRRHSASTESKELRAGRSSASIVRCQDGTTMRNWLMGRCNKFDRNERIHIFKQVAELVDISHSQGLVLQHLRPSYFMMLPANQVRYSGSLCPEGQMKKSTGAADQDNWYLEKHSERKTGWEQDGEADITLKRQRLDKHSPIGTYMAGFPASDHGKQLKVDELDYTNMFWSKNVSSFGCKLPKFELAESEERWYASPEELREGVYSFSSNIYSIGILLFELFCNFEAWEVHSSVMSDLRYRILPPNFLSENSKEASFCLLLLHPESFSRPKSRDILSCGLICEGRDLPSSDQSSASVDEKDAEAELLLHFLQISREQKEKQVAKLVADLGCLQTDIEELEQSNLSSTKVLSSADSLIRNIDQLRNAYFSMRSKKELSQANNASRTDKEVLRIRDRGSQFPKDTDVLKESTGSLGSFFEGLCKYARYNRFEVCGSIRNTDILSSANVICSLSFDRDEEYFAAAGVSKKMKIFEFSALLDDSIDMHYPLIEMSNRSKISCACWNNYIKNYLASADYDGVVQLWDASTGQGFTQYTEHQKRAWSVDFSQADPVKLASGSDDCSVKLWSINEKKCIDTIRNTSNVCCVQFSPYSSQLLALGCADYKIYCYDLRFVRIPWCTLSGHGRTVSYVKFVDSETLVSASTDNTLKLWDLNKSDEVGISPDACTLTFNGHTNEKNFIGLSILDGYVACGSETNDVYAYYQTLPMPITSHKFASIDTITGQETSNDNSQFVSSVCWRNKSNMLVAANSSGNIKLLQLV